MGRLGIEPSSTEFQIQRINTKFIQALTGLSGLKGGDQNPAKMLHPEWNKALSDSASCQIPFSPSMKKP